MRGRDRPRMPRPAPACRFLFHRCQRDERAVGAQVCFFVKFALRGSEKVGLGLGEALGNGPSPIVLLCPEWPARMGEQDFEVGPAAECQKTGADFWPATHAHNLTLNCGSLPQVLPKAHVLCMILSRLRPQCRPPRPCSIERAVGGGTANHSCTGANANAISVYRHFCRFLCRFCRLIAPIAKAEDAPKDVKGLYLMSDYPAVTLRPARLRRSI